MKKHTQKQKLPRAFNKTFILPWLWLVIMVIGGLGARLTRGRWEGLRGGVRGRGEGWGGAKLPGLISFRRPPSPFSLLIDFLRGLLCFAWFGIYMQTLTCKHVTTLCRYYCNTCSVSVRTLEEGKNQDHRHYMSSVFSNISVLFDAATNQTQHALKVQLSY